MSKGNKQQARKNDSAKKASPAKAGSKSSPKGNGLKLEVWGLVSIVFALILFLSLITYHKSPFSEGGNLIGDIGQHIALYSLQGFGYSSYLVILAIVALGIILSRRRSVAIKVKEVVGFFLIAINSSVLLDLVLESDNMPHKPGGLTGDLINRVMVPLFGEVGTGIIFFLILILAIVLATGIPPIRTAVKIANLFSRGLKYCSVTLLNTAGKIAGFVKGTVANIIENRRKLIEEARQQAEEAQQQIAEETERATEEEEISEPLISGFENEDETKAETGIEPEESKSLLDKDEREIVIQCTRIVEESVEEETEPDSIEDNQDDTIENEKPKPKRKRKKKEEKDPEIVDTRPKRPSEQEIENAEIVIEEKPEQYELPPVSLLHYKNEGISDINKELLFNNARLLERTLLDYKIEGKVTEIHPGPVITMYEFAPARGTKLSKIVNLEDDLAMALAALKVRIVAPIPGKSVVGIEVPSAHRETVYLKEIIGNRIFSESKSNLTVALGKDIFGNSKIADLQKMPHLLIAGATGAGKSVGVNTMILSILFRNTPDQVRFILIDPKRLEFNFYEDIPHLLLPVVTDPKQASLALGWVVHEMDKRYELLSEWGVKNIDSYNKLVRVLKEKSIQQGGDIEKLVEDFSSSEGGDKRKLARMLKSHPLPERMPFIVVVIDELADLMMVAGKEVELSIARLAQLARASGIHLIVATQRPSTDVLTGLIKNNFPARISFRVAQKVDSRVILDMNGAESLLGRGDMLYIPAGGNATRVHGAFVSEKETNMVVDFIRSQKRANYKTDILDQIEQQAEEAKIEAEDYDSEYDHAVAIVCDTGKASISFLQRKLRIGYNRAARIVEKMEEEGIVGPSEGVKGRAVYGRKIPRD